MNYDVSNLYTHVSPLQTFFEKKSQKNMSPDSCGGSMCALICAD